jgi:hypothetical protein
MAGNEKAAAAMEVSKKHGILMGLAASGYTSGGSGSMLDLGSSITSSSGG